jgi:hypothetical protein
MFQGMAAINDIEVIGWKIHVMHVHHDNICALTVEVNPNNIIAPFGMKIIQFCGVTAANAENAAFTQVFQLGEFIDEIARALLQGRTSFKKSTF